MRDIRIVTGDEALALMGDPAYRAEWQALYADCPWATSGQDPRFVSVRCRVYRSVWDPMIVEQRQAGRLVGLLPLARRATGPLQGAGAEDCEYHAWLADPTHAESFMPAALDALWGETSLPPLHLKYVPPLAPLGWARGGRWRGCCRLTPQQTPVLFMDSADQVQRFLRSKERLRTRMNQVGRLGNLRFRRVTACEDFASLLDGFIRMFDARKLAMHGMAPFRQDPLKRELLLARMAIPNLQHVTVLELDGRVIAAHIGLTEKPGGAFALAGVAHDEQYQKYSVGSLLLWELLQLLCREGYRTFDLTPGGDAYKERWSSATRTVHALTIYPSRAGRYSAWLRRLASRSLRKFASGPAVARGNGSPRAMGRTRSIDDDARRRAVVLYLCEPAPLRSRGCPLVA